MLGYWTGSCLYTHRSEFLGVNNICEQRCLSAVRCCTGLLQRICGHRGRTEKSLEAEICRFLRWSSISQLHHLMLHDASYFCWFAARSTPWPVYCRRSCVEYSEVHVCPQDICPNICPNMFVAKNLRKNNVVNVVHAWQVAGIWCEFTDIFFCVAMAIGRLGGGHVACSLGRWFQRDHYASDQNGPLGLDLACCV